MNPVFRSQVGFAARRPARLVLTGLALAVAVAAFVVSGTLLVRDVMQRTVVDQLSSTPVAVDLVVGEENSIITREAAAAVRSVPGVSESVSRFSTHAIVQDRNEALSIDVDPGAGPLSRVKVVQGTYPKAANQVAVSRRTADRLGLTIGGVAMATFTGRGEPDEHSIPLTVTAIVDTDRDWGFNGYAPEAVVKALPMVGFAARIEIQVADGADPEAVREQVGAAVNAPAWRYKPEQAGDGSVLPLIPEAPVRTGTAVRAQEARGAVSKVNGLFAVVGMFLAVAVGAAVLVAISTFRIVFAQRMRQLALLRAVGAGRGALIGALVAEGGLIGLVAGSAGVLTAVGVGLQAPTLAAAFDVDVLTPQAPVVPLAAVVVGTVVVAVVSVLAFTASRVAPLEALRAASTQGTRSGIGWLRAAVGILAVVGAGLIIGNVVNQLPHVDDPGHDPSATLLWIACSGGLAYFALVALGPVVLRPALTVVGWPLRRLGPLGRLAVGGVGGAPRRAAAVSVVVALGVTLVAATLVGGASLRALAEQELAVAAPSDFVVAADKDTTLPTGTVQRARESADVTRVVPYRMVTVDVEGAADMKTQVADVDLKALAAWPKLRATKGSLDGIGPGKAVVTRYIADQLTVGVGDTVTVRREGRPITVVVAAILDRMPFGAGVLTERGALDGLGVGPEPTALAADAARTGETARTAARTALRSIGGADTELSVGLLADQRDDFEEVVNAILAVALGLVGLTVLIAVVGVGSTTALSVVERVREAGLLRAVGMSRAGLWVMLTTEASLYGIIGSVIGLGLAVPYSWLTIVSLGKNVPVEMPVFQLALVMLALTMLTALAGVLPARRAAKTSPVVALTTGC